MTPRLGRCLLILLGAIIAAKFASAQSAFPTSPQTEPAAASPAKHQRVVMSSYLWGGRQYWLFEPDQPKPDKASLVLFLHGWGQMNPVVYGGWIDHLVRRGHVVVYPCYQDTMLTLPGDFLPNVLACLRDALRQLSWENHVAIDPDRMAVIGHSCGGILGPNYAAIARQQGLPVPRVILCVAPGRSRLFTLMDLSKLDAGTHLAAISTPTDGFVGDMDARRILHESTAIAAGRKHDIFMRDDWHGRPVLRSGHLACLALDSRYDARNIPYGFMGRWTTDQTPPVWEYPFWLSTADAVDRQGFWRVFDAMWDSAFAGRPWPDVSRMGSWSDGVPVRVLEERSR
ncbi:MAG: alpha/beta hydrolase fold domain-containing protein [Phycisphaeraceae bacterium]|nr:alpha/beta hydrolase fold domain-containing protein [Phycisphaeraceae bacterium]